MNLIELKKNWNLNPETGLARTCWRLRSPRKPRRTVLSGSARLSNNLMTHRWAKEALTIQLLKGVDPNPTCRAIVATVLWLSKRPQNHLLFRITPFCYLKIKNLIKNVEIQANCFGTRHFDQCEIPETSTNPASHTHRKGKPLPPKVQNGTLPTTVLRQFVSNWQTPGSNRVTTMYADYFIHGSY